VRLPVGASRSHSEESASRPETNLNYVRTATLQLMDVSKIEPGAVFRFPYDDRPNRVLFHDSDVVMYDAWWPHLDSWGLADLKAIKRKRISYYITTVSTVLEKATYLRSDPLSAGERAVHRPDLPFAAVQDPVISWSSENTARLTGTRSQLNTSRIYLEPFGPRGATKAGVRVVADNGSSFTAEELFRKAQVAQARHLSDVMPVSGVGIYRSGLQRGLPAFYLWGSLSRLHEDLTAHRRQ
jgi:hypothetical protein